VTKAGATPMTQRRPQKKKFCRRGRGEEKKDGGIKRHHFERVSGLLQKVENMFGPVQCIKWTVL